MKSAMQLVTMNSAFGPRRRMTSSAARMIFCSTPPPTTSAFVTATALKRPVMPFAAAEIMMMRVQPSGAANSA